MAEAAAEELVSTESGVEARHVVYCITLYQAFLVQACFHTKSGSCCETVSGESPLIETHKL